MRRYRINGGEPLSPGATHFKLAMTWHEDDYGSIADIVVGVTDCTPGAGWTLGRDVSFDIRKRVELTDIAGRCIEVEVNAFDVPFLQTRRIYIADYYHSGSPDEH